MLLWKHPAFKATYMRCPNCGNEGRGRFCETCGMLLQGSNPAKRQIRKRSWMAWLLWLLVLLIGVPVLIGIIVGRHETEVADEQSQKQIEERRKFDATPEGKRAQAARDKAERKAEAQALMRVLYAENCEKVFLDHGFDVQCVADDERRMLIITGPSVNRVFAHQFFMVRGAAKALRESGFSTVRFSNDKSGFSSEYYSQEFDVSR